jgi:Homeodomain-like domain-containing protein
VHSATLRDRALALVAEGVNDCEIARRLGVPRTTVRDWRTPRYVPRAGRERGICPRCWRPTPRIAFSDADYAELLGLYLGDGHITVLARTERLRLSLDASYPTMNDEIEALLRRCFPDNRVGRVLFDAGSTVVLHVYSSHLSCLFPQTDLARSTSARSRSSPGRPIEWRPHRGPSCADASARTAACS